MDNMLKNFVDKILDLAIKPLDKILLIDGRTYSVENISPVKEPLPATICVSTLQGFCDFITAGVGAGTAFILIDSHLAVEFHGPLVGEFKQRPIYARASIEKCPFNFSDYMSIEQFIISLQTMFWPSPERDTLIKLVSNLKAETQIQVADDGISQEVTAKTGIAKVEQVKLPSPTVLHPIRTFLEVAQPESPFIFRMRKVNEMNMQCALFEADGGAWKIEAMKNIQNFLRPLVDAKIPIII